MIQKAYGHCNFRNWESMHNTRGSGCHHQKVHGTKFHVGVGNGLSMPGNSAQLTNHSLLHVAAVLISCSLPISIHSSFSPFQRLEDTPLYSASKLKWHLLLVCNLAHNHKQQARTGKMDQSFMDQ